MIDYTLKKEAPLGHLDRANNYYVLEQHVGLVVIQIIQACSADHQALKKLGELAQEGVEEAAPCYVSVVQV